MGGGTVKTPKQISAVATIAVLTEPQRHAMIAEHWTARVDRGLVRLGLVYWATGKHGHQLLKFRPLGLKVRAILQEQADAK